jgi:hypothetical protein
MADATIVIGATRPKFRPTITDAQGNVVAITGGIVRLQGTSEDLPESPIDVAGTIYDGANGVPQWLSLGTLIDLTDLGEKPSATYVMKVKYIDAAAALDWTEETTWEFVPPPDVS